MLRADVKAIDKTTRIRTLNIITGLQEGTRGDKTRLTRYKGFILGLVKGAFISKI
jgi:hypothetical protein